MNTTPRWNEWKSKNENETEIDRKNPADFIMIACVYSAYEM